MKLKFSAFCSSSEWSCHAGVELRVQKAVIFCGDAAPVISWWPRLLFKTRLPVRTNPWVALLWRSSLIVPWRSPPTAPEAAGMQESDVASAMGFCKTNLHCKTLILLHVCVFVLWTGVFVQTWMQKVPAPPFIRTSLKNASASLDCVFWFWHFLLCFCPGMTSGEPFLHALSKGRFTFRTVWNLDLKRVRFLCGDNVFGFFRRVLLALKTESGHLVEQNLLLFQTRRESFGEAFSGAPGVRSWPISLFWVQEPQFGTWSGDIAVLVMKGFHGSALQKADSVFHLIRRTETMRHVSWTPGAAERRKKKPFHEFVLVLWGKTESEAVRRNKIFHKTAADKDPFPLN